MTLQDKLFYNLPMKESVLKTKAFNFSIKVINSYNKFLVNKNDSTIAKQLLRSSTSIGANINEALYAVSRADFISKLHISLKECGESLYWLELLKNVNIKENFDDLIRSCKELRTLLTKSIKTAKSNLE